MNYTDWLLAIILEFQDQELELVVELKAAAES
jgi:hypothetical protein